MIRFIENIGDYYSQHFFSDDFPKKVFDKAGYVTQKKDADGNKTANHISEVNALISPLREKYYRFKNDLLNIQRTKDKVKRTHDFHKEVLAALGYINGTPEYNQPVHLDDTEVIPVRYNYNKGGKPYLFIMEMKAMINEGDKAPDGIYNQTWIKEEWEKVFPAAWGDVLLKPDVIKDALSELFLLPESERPVYVIMLAGAKIFLIQYEKWKYDSFLLFDLEELFTESQISANRDYLALFYALLAKQNFLGTTDSLLQTLDEDAHKAAYGVTQNLKKGVIYAVESLANEAIWFKLNEAKTIEVKTAIEALMADDKFAKELKDECLTMVYRLLFLFYAEAREDLEILPTKDATYKKGYSLDMLRDLEFVHLGTDSSKDGQFFSISLWKLFDYLHNGVKTSNGFQMKPLDSPLFDNTELKHLVGVQFRNVILQQIIKRLSLSDPGKGKSRGRISYGNLGINQLGSVYESLLAFSGFFASDTLIEVKAADDLDGKEGTFLVPLIRRDEFKEEEILKDPDNPQYDKQLPKGHFVYRLNGRDRKKSASYYTPEVLTQTTVKYTLKGIIDKLKERQEKGEDCSDEILSLKILEPAMGAAAFQNEVINQLADAYLELKETEEVRKGRKRITPGSYNDELQKVKAFIAANNVYGVDLNPTAVELGKLSLWLNCMHRNMETPFFAHRLAVGNAVVGCWLKVYNEQDVVVEYPIEGTTKQRTTPISKSWWSKSPKRIGWDKKGILNRKPNQYYHFLLPDDNMLASAGISLIKEGLTDAEKKAITKWKNEFKQPLTSQECKRLQKLSNVIDALLEEHYKQIKEIIKDTTSVYAVYGQIAPQIAFKGYNEKERLAESRNARSAPFYKLRMVMDYWCSLWFWDARNIINIPKRTEWYNEIENILGIDLSGLDENASSKEILENIKKQSVDSSTLFGSKTRLQTVEALRDQHRFFHHELEFLEVFKEKRGFDVIVGNPPWVKIEFEGKLVMGEFFPELIIRGLSAPKIRELNNQFFSDSKRKEIYFNDLITAECTAGFMTSPQNYFVLKGHQPDLYKNILVATSEILNMNGYQGLLHPTSVFDDAKGALLREYLLYRLNYLFHFRNELKLFRETNDKGRLVFSVNIYSKVNKTINFKLLSNLFNPSTIDGCFLGKNNGDQSIKVKDKEGKYVWNVEANKNRVVHIDEEFITMLCDAQDVSKNPKLIYLQSNQFSSIIKKVASIPGKRISDSNVFFSRCFDETNDVGTYLIDINQTTRPPDLDKYEFVYNGPHFTVLNPISQSPKKVYKSNNDYQTVYPLLIDETFFPNTKYIPNTNGIFDPNLIKFGKNWFESFRWATRAMIGSNSERTLQPCIIPPKSIHINGVLSIMFENESELISFLSLTSSIVIDFYVKVNGWSNIHPNSIKKFPICLPEEFNRLLWVRVLLSNCLNIYYAPLWERNWRKEYLQDRWSKEDIRLKSFSSLSQSWDWSTPLRNWYERRQALVEIDVITAMAIRLTLEELILMYTLQFSVLQQNEDNTWFDQRGNIAFTSSELFNGVGMDRFEWEKTTKEVNAMQRTLKNGDTYEHTITKSELYYGQKITYYAPFDKFDRVEDYKVAWAHFKKIFNN